MSDTLLPDFFYAVTNDVTISGIIGTRLYSKVAPQEATMPYAVYRRISKNPDYNLDGASAWVDARIQIDIYAETNAEARSIESALEALLSGHTGVLKAGSSVDLSNILYSATDGYESEDSYFHEVIDLEFSYKITT